MSAAASSIGMAGLSADNDCHSERSLRNEESRVRLKNAARFPRPSLRSESVNFSMEDD